MSKVHRIYSRSADYQKLEVLATNRNKRYRYFEFLVEGVRNINEAIRNDWKIVSFIYPSGAQLSDWARGILRDTATEENIELEASLMQELSEKEDSSELMAVVRMREDDVNVLIERPSMNKPYGGKTSAPLYALFDRPSNKGNLGTIIRTLDALGADGLILTGHGVDLYDREVVVATMGSFFSVPVIRMARHDDLAGFIELVKQRYGELNVIGTTAHAELPLSKIDLTAPTLFMIGCETDGLSQGLRPFCTQLATIPMADTSTASSFNVACATTVMFYEAIRQRLQ